MLPNGLKENLGLNAALEELEQTFTEQDSATLEVSSTALGGRLREGTATLEEVENFLQEVPKIPSKLKPQLQQFLRLKKGWLLIKIGRAEEALQQSQEVLRINQKAPTAWALKASALLQLERFDEACQAFQQAYLKSKSLHGQEPAYLTAILKGWSGCSLLWGLRGILQTDLKDARAGVQEYLSTVDQAVAENLGNAVMVPLGKRDSDSIPEEIQAGIEELEVMVRLLSIKDPFEGWRELGKELSKVWPKDVSALDAIREQRDREWPT